MHTNHSFVVVAAVKAQFREPSTPRLLIQPRRRTHRTRWSWRGENPVQWWHNLDSSSEKLGLQRSRVMATPLAGGSAVSTADYPGGWGCRLSPLPWQFSWEEDCEGVTCAPSFHTTLQSMLLCTGSYAHKELKSLCLEVWGALQSLETTLLTTLTVHPVRSR